MLLKNPQDSSSYTGTRSERDSTSRQSVNRLQLSSRAKQDRMSATPHSPDFEEVNGRLKLNNQNVPRLSSQLKAQIKTPQPVDPIQLDPHESKQVNPVALSANPDP